MRGVIRKLIYETDSTSLFDPKELIRTNQQRCISLIEEGLGSIRNQTKDELDDDLNELVGDKNDLEFELKQAIDFGPEVVVSIFLFGVGSLI